MGGGKSTHQGPHRPDSETMQIQVKTRGGHHGPLGDRHVEYHCKHCCCGVWVYEDNECYYKCCKFFCCGLFLIIALASFLLWYYLQNVPPPSLPQFDVCPSQTGVTCSKQSDCGDALEQECFSNKCFCRVGFCAVNGKCEESCQKTTPGTCSFLECDASRGPTDCLGMPFQKKCYCKKGSCHINGRCTDITCAEVDTTVKCTNETGCPSSLGSAECSGGSCQCKGPSVCLENKVCVNLAKRWPSSNSSLPDIAPVTSLSQNQMQQSFSMEIPLVFLGSMMLLFAVLVSVFKMRVQRRAPSDFAEQLLDES